MNKMFTASWFFNLERTLRGMGLDADDKPFDEIKEFLSNPKKLLPDEFAYAVFYVILVAGFSQKTAKKIHRILVKKIPESRSLNDLLKIFNNKNKMNSIMKVWQNRKQYRDGFYEIEEVEVPYSQNATVDASISVKECSSRCLMNCTCMAYAPLNITESSIVPLIIHPLEIRLFFTLTPTLYFAGG